MSEAAIRTAIVKKLNSYSGYWFVLHQDAFTTVGLPDIVGVYAGYFYGLEVKQPGKLHTLTKKQSKVLDRIRAAGGKATVVTSVNDAMAFVFGNTP